MTTAAEFPFSLIAATHGIADARTPVIERDHYECCTVEFIYRGRGFLEIDGHAAALAENQVYFLHKGSCHRYWPDKGDPWHKIFFVVDGALMEYLFRIYGMDRVYSLPEAPQLRKYFDEMMRVRQRRGALHRSAAIIFHRFLEECHDVVQGGSEPELDPVLARLKRYLDSHVEEKVSLAEYCRSQEQSCASLIRKFRKQFGTSPYDYLMQKRVEEARLMLRHSSLSVKEIASRLKFSDPYYFSNYFKRKTGLSPRRYQRG